MLKLVTTNSLFRYVPEQEDGGPDAVLLLKPWSKRVYAAVLDCIQRHAPLTRSQDDGIIRVQNIPNRLMVDGVRCAIAGFENVADEAGNPVAVGERKAAAAFFDEIVEMAPDSALDPLPFNVVRGAFLKLLGECQLSEDDRKNS